MLPGNALAVQLASLDELVHRALGSGIEVAHDHTKSVAVALAHNVVHDVQQGAQLSNLHAQGNYVSQLQTRDAAVDYQCAAWRQSQLLGKTDQAATIVLFNQSINQSITFLVLGTHQGGQPIVSM